MTVLTRSLLKAALAGAACLGLAAGAAAAAPRSASSFQFAQVCGPGMPCNGHNVAPEPNGNFRQFNNRGTFNGSDRRSYHRRPGDGPSFGPGPKMGYSPQRFGPRYPSRRRGFDHFYNGFWYATPWWLSAMPAPDDEVVVDDQPAVAGYDEHVDWCMQTYRSYDQRSDSFMGLDGNRHLCVGP